MNGRKNDKCTVYLLTCVVNWKRYVGQTWYPLNIRMGKNGANYSNSIKIYNAIQHHGVENFKYDVLTECTDQIDADYWGDYYISSFDTINSGYNLKEGGSCGQHTDETKKKISEALKGRVVSAETRKKISIIHKGKIKPPTTDSTREKLSESQKIRHKKIHAPNAR